MKKLLTAAIMVTTLTTAAGANASFIVNEYNGVSSYAELTTALASNKAPSSVTKASVIDFREGTGDIGAFSIDNSFPNSQTTKFGLDIKTNLVIDVTADYYFRTFHDDGVALFIDNVAVLSDTVDHSGQTTTSGALNLTAGLHSLELQFYQNDGFADLELSSSRTREGIYKLIGASDGLATDVPEPATLALFGLGLLGFAASRRKSAK
jgi:hypothetical protein